MERWARDQLFTCWEGCHLAVLLFRLEKCEIVEDDLNVSVTTLIQGITSSNSRSVRSAFPLWDSSTVSVMQSTQSFGM